MTCFSGIRAFFLDGDGSAFISEERNRRAIEKICAYGGFKIDKETFWDIPGGDAGSGDDRVWHMIVNGTDDNAEVEGVFEAFEEFKSTYPNPDSFQKAVDKEYMANLDGLNVNQPVLDLTNRALRLGMFVAGTSNANRDVFDANLRHTGYPVDQFIALVGKDDVLAEGKEIKPSGDGFLMAMERANRVLMQRGEAEPLIPEQCMGVEDSRTGARASMAAGFVTIHLSHESEPLGRNEITDPSRYLYISPEDLLKAFDKSIQKPPVSVPVPVLDAAMK